jgi:hypothetical protein
MATQFSWEDKMKKRIIVTVVGCSLLAIILLAWVISTPAPVPLSEEEKAEIAKKIEWNICGNIITGKLPVVEFSTDKSVFRIVRVFHSGNLECGYTFEGEYFTFEFGRRLRPDD